MTTTMTDERYTPTTLEQRWMQRWLDADAFRADPDAGGEPFSIVVPPPNVTGALHMGHALNASVQDVLVRARRMQGYNAVWLPGTDHAGIATQSVVEKQLRSEGTSRLELGRDRFVERVQEWKDQYSETIMGQFRRLGASMDYARERFTMDDGYARAVLKTFVHLYEKGYIYRDNYIVNWDPGSGTAISDLEVEQRELTDEMVQVRYPLVDGTGHVVVATVRPETIPADVAVCVHPDDERYASLVGRKVRVPISNREVPVIADEYVDPEFGTGVLKITPGHDPNDFEIGRRHGLEELSAIDFDGRMTDICGPFEGIPADDARGQMTDWLEAEEFLEERTPYTHAVPHSHRSGARVEPLISLQWFCDMQQLAAPAIAAAETGEVRFIPEGASRLFFDWMRNIRPWCLSRQLWWGHQLPVWYRDDEVHVSLDGPANAVEEGWVRDPDVLDTWFSSSLWSFATWGWPERTRDLEVFHPTAVLSTARDIINLWVARMMMFSYEFLGEKPFSDVYVHSVVQAADGRRMSKSLGTGIDPLDMADQHGADGTRYGLLAMSSTQDVRFNEGKIREGRDLANKLWNAVRLVTMDADPDVLETARADEPGTVGRLSRAEDAWILARAAEVAEELSDLLDRYEFALYTRKLYSFAWSELCDWYVEMCKHRLRSEDAQVRAQVTRVLGVVLDVVLRLAHPVMPHVTEELAARLWPRAEGFLMHAAWPDAVALRQSTDPTLSEDFAAIQEAVLQLRSLRTSAEASPKAELPLAILGEGRSAAALADAGAVLLDLAKVRLVDELDDGVDVPAAGVVLRLGGIDRDRLVGRIDADIAEAEAEVARARGKLGNDRFTARAPEALVAEERDKLATWTSRLQQLTALRAQLG